ncbi:hypothetical protein OX283_010680 [Flavobacterium sp. SUN052]|uniref:hypothetical protein n=1 Tax=Flavobacterium sp. SUN052 TaxID=3002441 RepID=UPI00237E29A9|nr:hypothetical protein [Flavobacterium sp. SUN052]MEC4005125.1 hypothetical protein [Flavobacterium sp. SUN052]
MKKNTFTFLLLLACISANSQELLEKITKEVCSCVDSKKDKSGELSPDNLKTQLGLCILTSYTANEKQIKSKYGDILNDEKAMDKFGGDIGVKMVTVCPETIMAIAGAAGDEKDEVAVEEEKLTVEGKISEIKNDQFTSIIVKDKNSRVYTFFVLDYFETASLITGNEIKKDDNVLIYYSDIELYDNKTKEFRFFKVISGIEKK